MALVCSDPFAPIEGRIVAPRTAGGVEFVASRYEAICRGKVVSRIANHPTVSLLTGKLLSQTYHAFLQTLSSPSGKHPTSSEVHRVHPSSRFGK